MQITPTMKPIKIDNEKLARLQLRDRTQKDDLNLENKIRHDLKTALLKGRNLNRPVRIVLNSHIGPCSLETAVWTTTEKNIIISGGSALPINCVESIDCQL